MDENALSPLEPPPVLHHDQTKIVTYETPAPIPCIGKFQANIETTSAKILCTVHVVKGNPGSLLGYTTANDFGIIQVLNQIDTIDATSLYKQYLLLFSEVGALKDFKVKLHFDPEVQPVAQTHRTIPFHIRKKVDEKLEKLEKEDIIERVEGPTPWVSPIVTPPLHPNQARSACV